MLAEEAELLAAVHYTKGASALERIKRNWGLFAASLT